MGKTAMKIQPVEVRREPTELEKVQTAIAGIDRVAQGLAELKDKYGGAVYEVAKPDGMAQAKADRQIIRAPRYEVENIRKDAKAPLLALGKKLDAEAARITAAIEAIEKPIDAQIKAEELRVETERQAKIDAEIARTAQHQERLNEIREAPQACAFSSAAVILQHIGDIERYDVGERFEEFQEQAGDAKAATLAKLHELHDAALVREAEAERVRKESMALKAQQRELAEAQERDRKERETRDIEDARRRQDDQRKLDEREAALKRQEEEIERKRRAAEAPAPAAVEPVAAPVANVPDVLDVPAVAPTPTQIVRVVAEHFQVSDTQAATWLHGLDVASAELRK